MRCSLLSGSGSRLDSPVPRGRARPRGYPHRARRTCSLFTKEDHDRSRACPLRRLRVALRFIFRLLINFLSTLHFTSEVSTFYSSSAYPTRRGRNITEMPRPGGPSPTQHATCQYSACHRTSVRPCHVRSAAVSMEAAPCSPVAPHSPGIVLISAVRHFYRLTTTKVELRAIVAPPGAARWK